MYFQDERGAPSMAYPTPKAMRRRGLSFTSEPKVGITLGLCDRVLRAYEGPNTWFHILATAIALDTSKILQNHVSKVSGRCSACKL